MGKHKKSDKEPPNLYRAQELVRIANAIRAREGRAIVSLPQMGISSFLRGLGEQPIWQGLALYFAYLNCDSPAACADLEIFYERIAEEFARQKLGTLNPGKRGYARLEELIRRMSAEPNRRLVIIVDEADVLIAAAEARFYSALEYLTDANESVCYLIALKPQSIPSLDPDERLFAGRVMVLGPLNRQDLEVAISQNEKRHNVKFTPEARAKLAVLSGGHLGLLRGLVSTSIHIGPDWSASENELVERFVQEKEVQARCRKIWKALTPAEQNTLRAIATGKHKSIQREHLGSLMTLGVLVSKKDAPQIFSPLLRNFVLQETAGQPNLGSGSAILEIVIDRSKPIGNGKKELAMQGRVFVDGKQIPMRPQEFQLLACLAESEGLHYYDELQVNVILGGDQQDRASYKDKGSAELQGLVSDLRRILGKEKIRNHPGLGYQLEWDGTIQIRHERTAQD